MIRIVATAVMMALALAGPAPTQGPAGFGGPDSFPIQDFATMPRPESKGALLRIGAIQDELKLTDTQRRALEPTAVLGPLREKIQAARAIEDPQKRAAAIQAVQREAQ